MGLEEHWRNRIISTALVRAGDFVPNERNWRGHPHTQEQALDEVLTKVGWCGAALVNKRTSEEWGEKRGIDAMVDGHERVAMALSKGDEEPVPTLYVDLTPSEETMVLASFDPISAMAFVDAAKLQELMGELEASLDDGPLKKELERLAQMKPIELSSETEKAEGDAGEGSKSVTCPKCGHCFAL